jgi:hypothetical protein
MVSFQRAWTMPMRRLLPSWSCGAGPLLCILPWNSEKREDTGYMKPSEADWSIERPGHCRCLLLSSVLCDELPGRFPGCD